ncbi:MAG TPA: LpqB family beta-propeller domain-containing protein, partial [Chloroflexota bacterium]|nr:LpqB family beta-propeller domain-containing protein [Chloroflexota bacterium]
MLWGSMPELRAEAVADLATPRELDLSPDGRLVVYAMAPHGKREEHGTGALWVAPVDGSGAPRQFTAGVANDRRPRWSPDGEEVAFLSDRATRGTAQLYAIPAAGGEARAVTGITLKRPVLDFAWSPGGGHLAFTSADEPDAEDERRTRERDDARVYGERHAYARLRVLSRATGEVTTLAGGERHITAFAWSPDGAQLAYVAQRTPA